MNLGLGTRRAVAGPPHGDDNTSTVAMTPAMTSNTAPAPFVVATSAGAVAFRDPWNAFSQSSSQWETPVGATVASLDIKLDALLASNKVIILPATTLSITPLDFNIEASVTGIFDDTDVLLEVTGFTAWDNVNGNVFTWANDTVYKAYRINIFSVQSSNYIALDELTYIQSQGT